jgi:orotate phosphoribosyltransferase-like protein
MVEAFKVKHENEPYEFVHDWLEIQEQTERLITGGEVLSGLTMKAYWHTMATLKGEY